jgi:NAD(P)-dependent dehydrogenase (short-subunit alcohol dehydrogenase family)
MRNDSPCINAIAPDPIPTADGIGAAAILGAESRRRNAAPPTTGRGVRSRRVASWLLSDAASFVTGTTIPIDGGKLAGS